MSLLSSAVLVVLLGLSVHSEAPVSTTLQSPQLDMTSRILEANRLTHILVEGDVVVSKKRNALKCWSRYCTWKKSLNGLVEVPYSISDYYYDEEKVLIQKAMETFHQKTCVRFVPYRGQSDHLSIQSEMGCWSSIGRDGGAQVVSLSVYGCLDHGTIQHELLHALGFHHEHTRSDRDQYVRINWENLPAVCFILSNSNYSNKIEFPTFILLFCFFFRTAFSSALGAETITPIPDSSVPTGQREDMSDLDVLRVNRLYGCSW
uniref:Metalloendopeptidase n=1 Tax=Cynoglossus semilaevis TaxID=244447 RepID=A0A3P8WWU0_CYNSE